MKHTQREFDEACKADPSFFEEVKFHVSQVGVFAGLSPEDLEHLVSIGQAYTYDPDELIFEQKSKGDSLHVVLSGKVLLLGKKEDGSSKLVGERERGESFGEISLLTESDRNLSAVNSKEEESLQLVFRREDFSPLIEQHPTIGFTVYGRLVESIQERLEPLPAYFRNLVLWGYRPVAPAAAAEGEDVAAVVSKPAMLGLSGLVVGIVQFLLVRWVLRVSDPALYAAIPIMKLGILGFLMVLLSSVTGFSIGMYYDSFERKLLFEQSHAKCCAACKFVIYANETGDHGCLFGTQADLNVNYKLGVRPDTYTNCASFEPGGGPAIKARQRDTMGKD